MSRRSDRDGPEEAAAHVPFRMVLASIIGLWLCYFLLTTLRADIQDLGFAREMVLRRGLASLAGIAITMALWLVLRLFDARPLWAKIAAALLLSAPAALLIAQANQLAFADLSERYFEKAVRDQGFSARRTDSGEILVEVPGTAIPGMAEAVQGGSSILLDAQSLQGTPWQQITEVAFGRYFMMLAWCALYLALLTGEKARAAERREGEYRRAAKAAELRSLRYQVNPHFLFNTLNSLSALVLTGRTQAAERMIQTISTFYRRSLAGDPTADVPLREEFALQKLYLDIESVRFPQRLRVVAELPPALEDAEIPGMILQPLVENSVKHAVALSPGQVTITIAAREEGGRLVVTVGDDGRIGDARADRGPDQGRGPDISHGIGLANVRDRLAARFGDRAVMASGRTADGYVTRLELPMIRRERKDDAGNG